MDRLGVSVSVTSGTVHLLTELGMHSIVVRVVSVPIFHGLGIRFIQWGVSTSTGVAYEPWS